MACAWFVLWRRGQVPGRDGLLVGGAVLLLYAPWIPTLISQAQHTAAPWSERPTPLTLLGIPFSLFGDDDYATPLLMVAVLVALRRASDRDGAIRAAGRDRRGGGARSPGSARRSSPRGRTATSRCCSARSCSRSRRSSRAAPRLTAIALAGVVAIWLLNAPLAERSNVRTVAAEVTPVIRPGDVVASTQPEQVPVLSRYLPSGVLYVTPLGMVFDERVTDWRNGLDRMRAGKPGRDLLPLLGRLGPGGGSCS